MEILMRNVDFAKTPAGLYVPKAKVLFGGPLDAVRARALLGGRYTVQHLRHGKVIDEFSFDNIIVNQGLDYILGSSLTGVTQITNWYVAPFQGNYTPVATDTAATIVASATESTAYTSTTRVAWTGVEGTQAATNSASVATFTFNAGITVYGAMLVSASAKSSTSGTLLSAAQFGTPKTVASTDQLLFTYTIAASSI
jgi:hypothetical protein